MFSTRYLYHFTAANPVPLYSVSFFSLLFVPMSAVFCRKLVLTLNLKQEKVMGNIMIQLKIIELL